MKYGVKHTNGAVEAISQFRGDLLPGFVEISEAVYLQGLAEADKHKALFFETGDQVFSSATAESARLDALELKAEQRAKLLQMSNELDLMVRLGEVTLTKQQEFDALKALYQA